MKIGINLLGLLPGMIGGGETYIRGLLHGLDQIDSGEEYVVFTNRDNYPTFAGLGPRFRRVLYDFSARWTVPALIATRVAGEQFYLPWRAAWEGLDAIHSPLDTVPLLAPCPVVMTLHDINFAAMPEATNAAQRYIAQSLVKTSARRARAILTVSEFSRREIIAALHIDPARVFAVPNGGLLSPPRPAEWPRLAQGEIRAPYVLAFSSVNGHKNISNLMRAFARLHPPAPVQLVVVGRPARQGESLPGLARELGIEDNVLFTGYLTEEEKAQVLQHARMLAFPSLYEGFGLPVIEAMSCDIPVACSTAAALPEVAGNAARSFAPRNVDEIRDALQEVLFDEALRARLTLQVYRQAAGAARSRVSHAERPSAAEDTTSAPGRSKSW